MDDPRYSAVLADAFDDTVTADFARECAASDAHRDLFAAATQACAAVSSPVGKRMIGKRKRSGGAVGGQAVLDEQLWHATHDSNTAEVTRLLAAGADQNGHKDATGFTAPMWVGDSSAGGGGGGAGANKRARTASEQEQLDEQLWNAARADDGNAAVVERLLAVGANPNGFRMSDHTTLIWASYKGHTAIVRALLGAGADLTDKDDDGDTALDNARARNHSAVVALLEAAQQGGATAAAAARQASWKRTRMKSELDKQFFFAVKGSKMDEVTRLLAEGADPNGHKSYANFTALIQASASGDTPLVQALLDAGADLNGKSKSGKTALYYARQRNHPEVVALLEAAQQGDGAGGAAAGGSTAAAGAAAAAAASEQGELDKQLYDAANSSNNKTAEVKRLLAAGADPNGHTDTYGGTALTWASTYGHMTVVQALLGAGADLSAKRDDDGSTAFMWASVNGYTEIVQALLGAGADLNAKDTNGYTALDRARAHNHPEVVALLEAAQQGGGAGRAAAGGGAAAAGAAPAAAASSSADGGGAGASKRVRTTFEQWALDKQLFDAAYDGKTFEITRLLAAGADPNGYKDGSDTTALIWASVSGNTATVQTLLGAGADLNAKRRCCPPLFTQPPCAPHRCSTWQDGYTALYYARKNSYSDIVALLEAAQQGGDVGRAPPPAPAASASSSSNMAPAAAASLSSPSSGARALAACDATIAVRNTTIKELRATIAVHEATIAARDAAAVQQDAATAQQAATITEQAATIVSLRRQLEPEVIDVDAGDADFGGGAAGASSSNGLRALHEQQQQQGGAMAKVKQEKGVAEQQREEAQDRLECTLCMDAERNVLFLPCSHVVACGGCAAELHKCPICRTVITQKLPMNMS